MQTLEGKVALVTGGGRGIGREVARRLAKAGARVAVVARTLPELEETTRLIEDDGGTCTFESCDVADPVQIERVWARLVSRLGPAQILINNAGMVESEPLARVTLEQWNRTLAVNLTSVFLLCKLAAPGMVERRFGRIVNISSGAGKRGFAYIAAYAASKHGLLGLTTSLADEFSDRGVTVNAVCPGYVETDMTRRNIGRLIEKTGRTEAELRKLFAQSNKLGHILSPEEVAEAVMTFVDPACGLTGETVDL